MSLFFSVVKRRANEKATHLTRKFLRDLESGVFKAPTSSDVLYTLRTEKLNLNRKSQSLHMNLSARDREIRDFEKRHPSIRNHPIRLNSRNQPPLSLTFAQKMADNKEGEIKAVAETRDMRRMRIEEGMRLQIDSLSVGRASANASSQLRIRQSIEEEILTSGLEAVVDKGAAPINTSRSSRSSTTEDNTLLRFGPQERRRKERKL